MMEATMEDEGSFGLAPDPSTNVEKMHALIELQNFDGSWELSSQLLKLIGVTEEELARIFADKGIDERKALTATVVAIAFLEAKVTDEEDVWEMVVEKAKGWLIGKVGTDSDLEEEIAQAKSFLASHESLS